MAERYHPNEVRRAGRRVRADLPGRLLSERRGGWGRSKTFEAVVVISSISTAGVALVAPDTVELQIGDEATLCIGNEQAPVRVRRREARLNQTIFFGVEFVSLPAGMLSELEGSMFTPTS